VCTPARASRRLASRRVAHLVWARGRVEAEAAEQRGAERGRVDNQLAGE
jgi:hypothetical protein